MYDSFSIRYEFEHRMSHGIKEKAFRLADPPNLSLKLRRTFSLRFSAASRSTTLRQINTNLKFLLNISSYLHVRYYKHFELLLMIIVINITIRQNTKI